MKTEQIFSSLSYVFQILLKNLVKCFDIKYRVATHSGKSGSLKIKENLRETQESLKI